MHCRKVHRDDQTMPKPEHLRITSAPLPQLSVHSVNIPTFNISLSDVDNHSSFTPITSNVLLEPVLVPHTSISNTSNHCSLCDRAFKSTRALKVHCSTKHQHFEPNLLADNSSHSTQTAALSSSQRSLETMPITHYSCFICTRDFASAAGLKTHNSKIHNIDDTHSNVSDTSIHFSEESYFSDSSSISNISNGSQESNSSTFSTSNHCTMCDHAFKSKRALNMHCTKMHKTLKPELRTNEPTKAAAPSTQKSKIPNLDCSNSNVSETSINQSVASYSSDSSSTSNISNGSQESNSSTLSTSNHCSICARSFKNTRALNMHCTKMHKQFEPEPMTHEPIHTAAPSTSSQISSMSEADNAVFKTPLAPSSLPTTPSSRHNTRSKKKPNLILSLEDKLKRMEEELSNQSLNIVADPLMDKLTRYHDTLIQSVPSLLTEKLSAEVAQILLDPSLCDSDRRGDFRWSAEDQERLEKLNADVKNLKVPSNWTWAADDSSLRGQYNHARLQYCVTEELKFRLIHCPKCSCTGLLVGLTQMQWTECYACHNFTSEVNKEQKMKAWDEVRPKSNQFPTVVDEKGDTVNLPELFPGDKAVIAPVFPCVTVQKKFKTNTQMKQESITLTQDPAKTWSSILPRTDLNNRFVIIERRSNAKSLKHIVADTEKVRQWLLFLFENHSDFIRMKQNNELELSQEALHSLLSIPELAEVHLDPEECDAEDQTETEDERRVHQAELTSGLSEHQVFSFDKHPHLYLNSRDYLRVETSNQIKIVKDLSEHIPIYCASSKLAFPHLYFNSEKAPTDFHDYKLVKFLLKKQTMFAFQLLDGKFCWPFASDDIHLMHSYGRLVEMRMRARVGYYLTQHPDSMYLPIDSVLKAFKQGFTEDGILQSTLPGISTMLCQIPNSRQQWYNARLNIDAISRDLGSANVFLTLNNDPRADPGVRRLIHLLETGEDLDQPPFIVNTDTFTKLLNKHAAMIEIYLCQKTKIFYKVFLTKICGVQYFDECPDWTTTNRTETSFSFSRVEFTSTRGVQHWHSVCKVPHVLETSLLSRIIHNGRVLRTEMKYRNFKPELEPQLWTMIEAGLIASRYVALFGESLSTNSFYSERMPIDENDPEKVINLNRLRTEFVDNYKRGNINLSTHPIMRTFIDPECDPNPHIEMAKIAAASCVHNCIQANCGGIEKTGQGCRFNFPQKTLNHTVAGVFQVNSTQMECRLLLRRTPGAERVPNLNRYLLMYWRANHDLTVLLDGAHKMRYVTKYASKSGRYDELLNEVIEYVSKRSLDVLPPNMKQVLTHLLLADVSHRSFLSKHELAYYVMDLPTIRQSFANMPVLGFYKRSNISVPGPEGDPIIYSDRTEYSAYAERCDEKTVITNSKQKTAENCLTKEKLRNMCYREFGETIWYRWVTSDKVETNSDDNVIEPDDIHTDDSRAVPVEQRNSTSTPTRRVRTRDITSGHWVLAIRRRRQHVRFSTVLYTDLPERYEPVTLGTSTPQTSYFELSVDKRRQLYRAFYELSLYVPWVTDIQNHLITDDPVRAMLEDVNRDPERDQRYSLIRLEAFWQVYMDMFNRGEIAPPHSEWWKDNQFSYSMYLSNQHNSDIHFERVDNHGISKATYEQSDELADTHLDVVPAIVDENDLSEYPSALNFLPPDTFRDVMEQKPPALDEIAVAFPMHVSCQKLQQLVTINSSKLFMATPPSPTVPFTHLTPVQQWAVKLGCDLKQQILYISGKAGAGKTEVALHICEGLRGRVQCGAVTGKAASNFHGPTVHGMFGWGFEGFGESSMGARKIAELSAFYADTAAFIVDEVNAMSSESLFRLHTTMTAIFNPNMKKNRKGDILPFGGKKLIFMGDAMQLPCVNGTPIYKEGSLSTTSNQSSKIRNSRGSRQIKLHKQCSGHQLYSSYLQKNVILLNRGQRSSGLLQDICDRLRNGQQTQTDLTLLTSQRRRFPHAMTDYGIHYDNESCSMFNWRQLWSECQSANPPRRLYICKASYHCTPDNLHIVNTLAALPPQKYNFASDVLCVTEGCDVRLIKNINVAAGLVNSAIGQVVKIIYDNADVTDLLAGKNPPPYCIVVSFPEFHGFPNSENPDERIFPFPKHPTFVPIYREKFIPLRSHLTANVIKKLTVSQCYRTQFPLDLARHVTSHRAQGQTLRDCLVSVDINLESPDAHLPADVSTIFYVACTRVTRLQDLFVSPIFPTFWKVMGRSDSDVERRLVYDRLFNHAEKFARSKNMLKEVKAELEWVPEYSDRDRQLEMEFLERQATTPMPRKSVPHVNISCQELSAYCVRMGQFSMCLNAVLSERHIGLDQGRHNFAIVVVHKVSQEPPVVMFAENYDLGLTQKDTAPIILAKLVKKTPLLSFMNPCCTSQVTTADSDQPCTSKQHIPPVCTSIDQLPSVDRVIVHVEQMSAKNAQWKEFGINLGTLLQQQVRDIDKCIVKLSQPHIHRSTGPIFKMGPVIVQELQLVAPTYENKRATQHPTIDHTPSDTTHSHSMDIEDQSTITPSIDSSYLSTPVFAQSRCSEDDDRHSHSEIDVTLTPGEDKSPIKASTPNVMKRRRLFDSDVEPSDSEPELSSPKKPRLDSLVTQEAPSTSNNSFRRNIQPVEPRRLLPMAKPSLDNVSPIVSRAGTGPKQASNKKSLKSDYKQKKHMSSQIFRYFMEADDAKQLNLGIQIHTDVQQLWVNRIARNPRIKLDDTGDALLHCLDAILCGSNYQQLVPATSSLHANRTIVITVLPEKTCCVVLHCTWNLFELENFATYDSNLTECIYSSPETVTCILTKLCTSLQTAISSMAGDDVYRPVDHIKIIVKQLTGYKDFTNAQAGTLTQSTVEACKQLCTELVGEESQLIDRHDKLTGWTYIQTNTSTKQKYQIIRSAGKHTNCMAGFLEYFLANCKTFVDNRLFNLTAPEKLQFFQALQQVAQSADNRLCLLEMSPTIKEKLASIHTLAMSDETKSIFADLILIGVDKNQNHIRAVATNYRHNRIVPALPDLPVAPIPSTSRDPQ